MGEDLLQQLLKLSLTVGITLPLHFLREQIHGAQATRVYLHCPAELDDGLRRIAPFAFQHTQQIINLIVLRSQLLRSRQPLCGYIVVSLAQRQHAPVRPACRLSLRKLGGPLEGAVSTYIIPHLQGSEPHIKGSDFVQIGLGRGLGQPGGMASTE